MADKAMAQGCAETGEMQAVAKQGDIVSNGKGNRNPRVFGTFCSKKYNKGSLKNEGYGELKCDVNHAF